MSVAEEQQEEEGAGDCVGTKAEGEGQYSLTSSTLPLIVTIVEDTTGFNFIWLLITNDDKQRTQEK
jgi:hypothetical protein